MMMHWARAPQDRHQLVLFSNRLDEALSPEHTVRLLDDILGRLDWTKWEARYHGRLGQPPIHPRVLASVLLYGLLTRIRSSRGLEEALVVRLDFRWLAEGRTIDHTTLSEFRRQHRVELKDLFVQVGLLARSLGWLPLEQLAFDGTRLRANNRRSGTRTPAELAEMKQALAQKHEELEARIAAEDVREAEVFAAVTPELAQELADTKGRLAQVDAALAQLQQLEEAGQKSPQRLPLTDPEARVTPNKDGGFAPNYTPLAMVDMSSGMIVNTGVIAPTDEDHHLVPALQEVQEDFGLERPSPEVLADGMMATGANLAATANLDVTLYSPVKLPDPAKNPALRADPSQPVPPEAWNRLPTKLAKSRTGQKRPQLEKEAFVYDAERDVYWCPQGQPLHPEQVTSERNGTGRVERHRYKAAAVACAGCPLRELCLQEGAERRQISRDQHESLREQHAQRMSTPEAQAKYARRRSECERPFAVIKHQFGARRFLLRGLEQVKTEWRWLATAFNLQRLMSLIRSRAGPAPVLLASPPGPP